MTLADGNARGLAVVLECSEALRPRAQYVLDSLAMSLGLTGLTTQHAQQDQPVLVYTADVVRWQTRRRAIIIRHVPSAWASFDNWATVVVPKTRDGVPVVFGGGRGSDAAGSHRDVPDFDLLANAFFFLSAWAEQQSSSSRQLFSNSVFERLKLPMDIVDRYLALFRQQLARSGVAGADSDNGRGGHWQGHSFAVALTHDVDYLPARRFDNLRVALRSAARHLVKQRSPGEAVEAIGAYAWAVLRRNDPFGCVPEIIAEEQRRGVRSSFQVAVGHRHPMDVNYRIEDDDVREYLAVITRQGFDLCLHGSYRSTEQPGWYEEEIDLLARRLGRPLGSRQHFLSFDPQQLFAAQERAGIQYDMSVGFPDRCGQRVGFSHPYFPYCFDQERPYDVLQIPLTLMDVTLRSYLRLRGEAAWREIQYQLETVRKSGGAVSVVWHPIVFGGARDPGFDRLYWRLVEHIQQSGGLATDGRTINALIRQRALGFASFSRPSPQGSV